VGLSVDSVIVSKGSNHALIEARLQESAQLYHRGQSSHTDAFRSTYSVRYEMHRDDAKSAWKIVGGAVLKDDNKAASSQRQVSKQS